MPIFLAALIRQRWQKWFFNGTRGARIVAAMVYSIPVKPSDRHIHGPAGPRWWIASTSIITLIGRVTMPWWLQLSPSDACIVNTGWPRYTIVAGAK